MIEGFTPKFVIFLALSTVFLTGCGNQTHSTHTASKTILQTPMTKSANPPQAESLSKSQTTPPTPQVLPQLTSVKIGSLPLGLMGLTLAANNGKVLSVGGYTGTYSVASVYELLPHAHLYSSLLERTHDAAVGFIGSNLYVFGGGQALSYNTIIQVESGHSIHVGTLPDALSDAVAVSYTLHGTPGLLVLCGYNGQAFNRVARFYWRQGQRLQSRVAFTLPVGLRYPAVAVNHSTVYISGGKTPSGLSSAVYQWNGNQSVTSVAHLPVAVQKAAAFIDGHELILVGGYDTSGQLTNHAIAISLHNGTIHTLPPFPTPIADMGYAQVGNTGYLAGGMVPEGVSAAIYRIDLH